MFGTSGIRGIYASEITEELALRVANVFSGEKLAMGRDIRKSGIPLAQATAAGATSSGADVIDLGIVPTPTVALATKKHMCRGIMITASHNPPEYNGLKLIENTKEIDKEMEKEVEGLYKENRRRINEKSGRIYADNEIVDDHKDLVVSRVDTSLIVRKKPKIIVDCNGAASVITPYLLADIGCNVISINSSLDGFERPSEPNEENLSDLSKLVPKIGADFAIAHDGDGDRCVIIDDTGTMLPLDVQLAMMIDYELEINKNKRIVTTSEASLVVREVVERAGGSINITPVGSTYVGDALESKGAVFGGEPCGEYIYEGGVHVPDAVMAGAKFVELFCMKGKFSKLKTGYAQHCMFREKFVAKDKYGTVEAIKKAVDTKETQKIKDGIRIDEEDGWFLIRASGTEPAVRLTMEYKSKQRLERRKRELLGLIRKKLI